MFKYQTFIIDDLEIPVLSCLDFNQDYDTISAFTTLRSMNGTGYRQGTYTKIKTTLSGSGDIPSGLSSINVAIPHVLKCAAPMSITSTSNIITLPSGRRTDTGYEPVCYALVDGLSVDTDYTIIGNVATLDTVVGASAYQIVYVPELNVLIEPIKESVNMRQSSYSWTLTAEEA